MCSTNTTTVCELIFFFNFQKDGTALELRCIRDGRLIRSKPLTWHRGPYFSPSLLLGSVYDGKRIAWRGCVRGLMFLSSRGNGMRGIARIKTVSICWFGRLISVPRLLTIVRSRWFSVWHVECEVKSNNSMSRSATLEERTAYGFR